MVYPQISTNHREWKDKISEIRVNSRMSICPPSVIRHRLTYDYSLDTVKMFYEEAQKVGYALSMPVPA